MKRIPVILSCALFPCILAACRTQAAPPGSAPVSPEATAAGGHRVPLHFTAQALAPDLARRLSLVLKIVAPEATVRQDGNRVIAQYHAHPAKLHPADMTGRRSPKPVMATVPGPDGFVLTLSLVEGEFVSQAVLGMEQPTDRGVTSIDAYVLQPGVLTLGVRLDRGKDARSGLTARLKQEVRDWVRSITHRATLQRPAG